MKSPAKRNVVFPAAEAEPEGFRKKDVLPKSSASFFFSLQSAVFSLQPVLPRAERMSGRAFWGSGRLPLTRAAGGIRICTEVYGGITIKSEVVFSPYPSVPPESYGGGSVPIRTAVGLQSEKPDPKKHAYSVRQARQQKKSSVFSRGNQGAKHPFCWRLPLRQTRILFDIFLWGWLDFV